MKALAFSSISLAIFSLTPLLYSLYQHLIYIQHKPHLLLPIPLPQTKPSQPPPSQPPPPSNTPQTPLRRHLIPSLPTTAPSPPPSCPPQTSTSAPPIIRPHSNT